MTDDHEDQGFVDRLSRQGEEALGRLAEELVANPVVSGAIGRALEAREKAVLAQEAAMGALNLPSAADIERLTRRLRSVSQRLEGIEDALDRLEDKATAAAAAARKAGDGGSEDLSKRHTASGADCGRYNAPYCQLAGFGRVSIGHDDRGDHCEDRGVELQGSRNGERNGGADRRPYSQLCSDLKLSPAHIRFRRET